MRTLVVCVIGLVGGFLAGLVVSEAIGVVGILAADRPVGIRFLPAILAVVCAVAAPLVDQRVQRGQR